MIAIIDYGMGNLRSVQKALEAVGQDAMVVSDPDQIRRASKVILPGVGAFADAIDELRRTGLGSWGLRAQICCFPNYRSLPDRGLNHGAGRRNFGSNWLTACGHTCLDRFTVALETTNPVRAAASCVDASAKALPWPGVSRRVSCRSYAS